MRNLQPVNDHLLVKVKKKNYITSSGIFLAGVEDDYLAGEVIAVGNDTYDDKGDFLPMDVKVGDYIVFEKQFHHVYDISRRDRIDHTVALEDEGEYDVVVTTIKDVYFIVEDKAAFEDKFVHGQLFSNGPPKPITRKQQAEFGL